MSLVERSNGKRFDWPQLEAAAFAALSAGNSNDPAVGQDIAICALPRMSHRYGNLSAPPNPGVRAVNDMRLAEALFISSGSANTVGSTTNNADLRLNLWRANVLQGCLAYYPLSINTTVGCIIQQPVSTTATTAVTSGSTVITPASMTGIVVGSYLNISGGVGTAELVTVTAVSSTTFTASFSNAHSGTYTIATVNVATTATTAVTSGSTVITPASMVGIYANQVLYVSGGLGGAAEYVLVASVTSTTFTATFANAHSGTYNISSSAASVGGQNPQYASSVIVDPQAQAVIATSMTGIIAGLALGIGSGSTFEVVYPFQVPNSTAFVANFLYSHPTSDAVTSILVPNTPISFVPANAANAATSNSLVPTGSQTVIPASIYGIHVGDLLAIAGGTTYENGLSATTVASTALTATFAQPHSGTSHIGYFIATTCSNPGATPTTLTPASMANLTVGQVLKLQGCGADSAVSDTVTITVVGSTTITITGAAGTYSVTANLTSVAYLKATTTTVANQPGQVLAMASTTGIAVGDLVHLRGLAANGTTGAFTGTGEVCFVQAVVTNTSITVSPAAVYTSTYAVVPFTKTTFVTAVTSTTSATTVTLASGTGFNTGQAGIYVWSGTQAGVTETVTVTAVANFTFTATFAQTHSGAYTITTTGPLLGPTGGQQTQLASPTPVVIRPWDVLTITRVSNINGSGIATPVGLMEIEWVPAEALG